MSSITNIAVFIPLPCIHISLVFLLKSENGHMHIVNNDGFKLLSPFKFSTIRSHTSWMLMST